MKKIKVITFSTIVISLSMLWSVVIASNIKTDESVIFFPTQAYFNPEIRKWVVPVHGWIFELEEDSWWRSSLLEELIEELGLESDVVKEAIFKQRMHMFLVDNERGKVLTLTIANQRIKTTKSTANGHFNAELTLTDSELRSVLPEHTGTVSSSWLRVDLLMPERDSRHFSGSIQIVNTKGISVISDVDDTVKDSNVLSKKELLKNTFTKPFEVVHGMETLYQLWQDKGYQFHYVSSSPWQLYPALTEFFNEVGLPQGSFHLKTFRVKDKTLLDMFASPIKSKVATIESIFIRFPNRKFILVGDSGEKDPDVYALIFNKYPDRVMHIYIHNVTNEAADHERYLEAFKGIDRAKWSLFSDPQEIIARQ